MLLAVVGVAVGAASSFLLYTPLISSFDVIVAPIVNLPFNASIFLTVFLPILLFHASLSIDVREIAQDAAPILTLAIVAVFAAAAAIGFGLSLAGVPLTVALLLGSIVATTDPAAVVTILREVGAPLRLSRLLEGEALLNDAAAIVLFSILVEMLTRGRPAAHRRGRPSISLVEFLGGIALGVVVGRIYGATAAVARRVADGRGHAGGGAALYRLPGRRRTSSRVGRRRGGECRAYRRASSAACGCRPTIGNISNRSGSRPASGPAR